MDAQFSLSAKASDAEYSPELQSVVMRLAQSSLILCAPSTLVQGGDGELHFAIKYDTTAESIEQLISRLEGCSFDGSAEMIAELVEDFSSISRLDVVSYFEQLIFAWVTGCYAVSPGSFALSHPNEGVSSLAPIFDFVPELIAKGSDKEFGLEVNGKRKNLRKADFESAMKFMDLKARIIRITIEKITKSREKWGEIIQSSFLSDELKKSYYAQISTRLSLLEK